MGCAFSTGIRVSNSRKVKNKQEEETPFEPIEIKSIDENDLHNSLETSIQFLLRRINSIRCPSGMVPTVAISKLSAPILISKIYCDTENNPTSIQLPIVSCTSPLVARILCFSHYKMPSRVNFRIDETNVFFHNCFTWLFSNFSEPTSVLFIEFPEDSHKEIENCFKSINFSTEFCEYDSNLDFNNYHCIAITSKFNVNEDHSKFQKLQEFVNKGNGLAIFYDFTNSLTDVPINSFLIQFGLSYTYCQLSDDLSPPVIVLAQNSKILSQNINFDTYCETFKTILLNPKLPNDSELDNISTFLRYHIMVCQKEQMKSVIDIMKVCYDFLKRTNYISGGIVCPNKLQAIVAILLLDIINKLPVEGIMVSPGACIFPGICQKCQLSNHSVTLRLHRESIISTGIWCQPGSVSTIECHNPPSDLQIQIGAHSLSLAIKPSPWKRWPSVYMNFQLKDGTTKVATPYGGIVYIVVGYLPGNSPTNIDISFNNFARHTIVALGKPEIYQSTKDSEAPWCEIMLNSVIFTAPRDCIQKIQNFDETFNFIEKHIKKVAELASYTIIRPYRIVFDNEITEKLFVAGYPIFLDVNDFDDIFINQQNVGPGFFKMLMAISTVSLKENCFDSDTEQAIAAYITANALNSIQPFFDPLVYFEIDLPLLFRLLWNIQIGIDKDIIINIIKESQNSEVNNYEVPEDKWINFVKKLCYSARCNLTKDLLTLRPIPLNVTAMLQKLPQPPFDVL